MMISNLITISTMLLNDQVALGEYVITIAVEGETQEIKMHVVWLLVEGNAVTSLPHLLEYQQQQSV